MIYKPHNDGRLLEGQTPFGDFKIELDGPCKCCHIIDADGNIVGTVGHEPKDPAPQPMTLRKLAHGAAGLAKSRLGIDRASDEVIEYRQNICQACDQAKYRKDGTLTKCTICGCGLMDKTRLNHESCPCDKWPAVEAAD